MTRSAFNKLLLLTNALAILFILLILLLPRAVASQQPPATPAATTAADSQYKVVGYFVQWGMYSRSYRIKQVVTTGSASKLTHINYAFANVSTESKCFEATQAGWADSYADFEANYSADDSVDGKADELGQPIKGHFNQIKKLKAMYPNLKVLLSIGGWTWSGRFSDAALPQNREAFVSSCIDLFIKGNLPMWAYVSGGTPVGSDQSGRAAGVFDGIDIDWEFPAVAAFPGDPSRKLPPNVYRPEDTQNFTALLAEFRRQLDELGAKTGKHYLLTIAAPPDEARYSKFELDKIHPYLDYINLMTYDIHGAWAEHGPTNFQAPLYLSPDDASPAAEKVSVDTAVMGYLKMGIPPKKIVVGIPFYGRGWTGVPDQAHGLYQSATTMKPAPATYEDGIEDYKKLKQLDYPVYHDPKTQSMWIFDGKTFWSYDDPQVIAAKTDYIKSKGLGGAMFWSLDGDDGTLISAIHDGLK